MGWRTAGGRDERVGGRPSRGRVRPPVPLATSGVTAERSLSRRTFLRGIAGLAGGLALSACSPAATLGPSAVPTPTGEGPSHAPATSTPESPTAAPSARPTPLPLRQRIARLLVVGFRGLSVEDAPWVRDAIADGLGGVILFDRDQTTGGARNVHGPDQVRRLVADLKALAADRELIVAIDQEGGLVTRLSPTWGYPAVASEEAIGAQGDAAVTAWADGIAATLEDAGINLNFAPVVDVNVNPANPAVGALDRSFSADPALVGRDAAIEVRAHRAHGVRTALKHFPGLGSASTNTDFGVADVTKTWTGVELDPYRALLKDGLVDLVMAAHVVNGQIDPSAPASLSKATVTDLLRNELGFNGAVVTDDMGAAAITEAFGFGDAIALALEAGDDLLLFANQQSYDPGVVGKAIDRIVELVDLGRVTEFQIDRSIARIDALFAGR
ncbi:MAG TPA: glycoside hydrolase family 3 N-terminal domain-containing protein [Candidatus Limnocylindrales bacterium]|nr:glycoside hydrolase family 3 N-terminal domain-containing protein [Candidatus Limnocylindrales bacterium]